MDKQTKNKLKCKLVEQGTCKEVAKASRHNFVTGDRSQLEELEEVYGFDIVKLARDINTSNYHRKQRIQKRIGWSVSSGNALFLTLTFTDEVLGRTKKDTRRQYVRRWLQKNCFAYVANIDFGGRNGREHYHALVFAGSVDYSTWHKYGAVKGEKVHCGHDDEERVCRYVAKLSNHAMKETCGVAPRLIYSRNVNAYKAYFLDPPF